MLAKPTMILLAAVALLVPSATLPELFVALATHSITIALIVTLLNLHNFF